MSSPPQPRPAGPWRLAYLKSLGLALLVVELALTLLITFRITVQAVRANREDIARYEAEQAGTPLPPGPASKHLPEPGSPNDAEGVAPQTRPPRLDAIGLAFGALPLGCLLALPLALYSGIFLAFIGLWLRRHGPEAAIPVLAAALLVGVAFWVFQGWIGQGFQQVGQAAKDAWSEYAFSITSELWDEYGWASLLLFPVLIVTVVIDIVLLPFIPLIWPAFWGHLLLLLLRGQALLLGGAVVGCGVTLPWLWPRWKRRAEDG